MKKLNLTVIAILTSLSAVWADTSPVAGSNGQVKFSGAITEKGCTLVSGNSTTIDLGSVTVATLAQLSGTALHENTWTQGLLKFIDCEIDSGISAVYLSILPGDVIDWGNRGTEWLWRNQGTAKNVYVDVAIIDKNGSHSVTGKEKTDYYEADIDPVNKTALFIVKGRIVGDYGKNVMPTPGSVEATVTFVTHYK
ncbi:hypothetical protein DC083_04260 [Ignatzschineria ureiclastica]|uniref:Type 1 fimbrial protein n=1 Tax=Ignatzschineria ureiclastica TaxID=472582 RepID=A0A2U2AEW1_9GAMM|nr:type 1 fimbrial protein [Ignatzschineria ureiclastica]PWD81119.1 hypothetical protein DC083_04260 [Ignatzschineria ureiclastica]GGZ96377.1 hypothetical protein GCM10007162_10580 [Ignatzschineria ureiclastica]